jgi:hypothetical protein
MTPDSPARRARRDGWGAARQRAFIAVLAETRSVTRAARAVGISRQSAYRLRGEPSGAGFAREWDRVMAFVPGPMGQPGALYRILDGDSVGGASRRAALLALLQRGSGGLGGAE